MGPLPAVLILAGARGESDPLLAGTGLASKALLPVAGTPMIDRVLTTVRPLTGEVWVSGLTEEEARGARVAPQADGPAAAVLAAVEADAPLPLLVTTADHPLLTAEMVRAFEAGARGSGADLCVGLAERGVIEAAFPDVKRTYLRFADAQVSGCNLFWVASEAGLAGVRFWREAERDRKKPWRLARRVGVGTLLRYAFGRLTMDGLFAHASRRLGARVAPVLLPFAEAAVDVDKPSDLALVTRLLEERAA